MKKSIYFLLFFILVSAFCVSSSKAATLEKISSPSQIKYYKNVVKRNGSLYGIKISSINTTKNKNIAVISKTGVNKKAVSVVTDKVVSVSNKKITAAAPIIKQEQKIVNTPTQNNQLVVKTPISEVDAAKMYLNLPVSNLENDYIKNLPGLIASGSIDIIKFNPEDVYLNQVNNLSSEQFLAVNSF